MKLLMTITSLFLFAATASAAQWKTVTQKKDSKNYTFEVSYPEFAASATPAYQKINKVISDFVADGCDAEEAANSEISQDYSAQATVVALNKQYVGVRTQGYYYCGGAHPDDFVSYKTFDAQTGQEIDMSKELGFSDAMAPTIDWDKEEKLRIQLATIMAKYLTPAIDENGCYLQDENGKQATQEQIIENLNTMGPAVGGLAKGKQVVLVTTPAHVAAVCRIEIRVPYSAVKSMVVKGSILEKWLK